MLQKLKQQDMKMKEAENLKNKNIEEHFKKLKNAVSFSLRNVNI